MSVIDVVQNSATWLPFVATDIGTGNPRLGITFSQIDLVFKKATETSFTAKGLTSPEFREVGLGVYEVLFSASDFDTLGSFIYAVNGGATLPAPSIKQFVGRADVKAVGSVSPGQISLPTNILTGNLIGLNSSPLVGEAVSARVLSAPNVIGSTPNLGGIGTDIVSAQTDSGGFFALEVLQGAVIEVVIPVVNYRRTLTVPGNTTDLLFDIP